MDNLENIAIDIDKDNFQNIDIDIIIEKDYLVNFYTVKDILENIDIDIDIVKDILGLKVMAI